MSTKCRLVCGYSFVAVLFSWVSIAIDGFQPNENFLGCIISALFLGIVLELKF